MTALTFQPHHAEPIWKLQAESADHEGVICMARLTDTEMVVVTESPFFGPAWYTVDTFTLDIYGGCAHENNHNGERQTLSEALHNFTQLIERYA